MHLAGNARASCVQTGCELSQAGVSGHHAVILLRRHGGRGARSFEAKRMQKSSIFCTSLAKSMVDQTQALSLPMCSVSLVPGITAPAPCIRVQESWPLNVP